MSSKRSRKANWSAEENDVFTMALEKYGRYNYIQIHQFLYEQIPSFDREVKEVKKKVYNFLQDNIQLQLYTDVRLYVGYQLLCTYKQQRPLCTESDQNIKHILQFLNTDYSVLMTNFQKIRNKIDNFDTVGNIVLAYSKEREIPITNLAVLLNDQHYYQILSILKKYLENE